MGTPAEALGLMWRSLWWALEATGRDSVDQLRMAEAWAAAWAVRSNPTRRKELYG